MPECTHDVAKGNLTIRGILVAGMVARTTDGVATAESCPPVHGPDRGIFLPSGQFPSHDGSRNTFLASTFPEDRPSIAGSLVRSNTEAPLRTPSGLAPERSPLIAEKLAQPVKHLFSVLEHNSSFSGRP